MKVRNNHKSVSVGADDWHKAMRELRVLREENDRLRRCYETATGKDTSCGEGSAGYCIECKQMAALRAELAREKEKARSCCCIWCGESIASYQGVASDLPDTELKRIQDACRKHDRECLKNPLRVELARKDALIEALETLCGRLDFESLAASEFAEHLEKIGVLSKEQADSFRSAQSETQSARARLAEVRGEK